MDAESSGKPGERIAKALNVVREREGNARPKSGDPFLAVSSFLRARRLFALVQSAVFVSKL